MKIISSELFCPNAKIAIAVSRFNYFITNNLLNGAIDALKRLGQVKENNIDLIWLPGSYELPMIVNELVKKNKYDAIIALGAIIRGETNHFNYIANSVISGLCQINLKSKIPISCGILTTNNTNQAIERSGVKEGNYGFQSAITILEMINLLKKIRS